MVLCGQENAIAYLCTSVVSFEPNAKVQDVGGLKTLETTDAFRLL